MARIYFSIVGIYGLATAGVISGLFYLFYSTGWGFSHSLSGLALWLARIFFFFIIMLLAISKLRQKAGHTPFLMVVTHVLLISTTAAVIDSAYHTYFYNQVDPQYEVKVYENALKAKRYALDFYSKRNDTPPKLLVDLKAQIVMLKENVKMAKVRQHDFFSELRMELTMYLLSALINSLALGVFFGILLRPAPTDTSTDSKVLYRREEPEEKQEES